MKQCPSLTSPSLSLVFTQYIELMNGIIETTKDVKVLRGHGILKTESLKDDEVVKIFSGTSKSVQLASTHELYKAIADVNDYYNGLRKVKARKFVKKCVYTLWNVRTLFAAILLVPDGSLDALLCLWLLLNIQQSQLIHCV
ncbi:hypothetical protein SO802_029588 [Lithocarpus litseifolius]|uniref:Uncharacterized protein n=1 Tax=Lithocarpus litseifolius TaxID=425828 RepID=A0AAW2BTT8_9ROSI